MKNNENKLHNNDDAAEESTVTSEAMPENEVSDGNVIRADNDYDSDMWISGDKPEIKKPNKVLLAIYDFVEMLAVVTIGIILCFSFIFRLNIVDGPSMENTLFTGEYLLVSDLLYDPTPGDIVVIHDPSPEVQNYKVPLVKRIIAVGGQTVDVNFETGAVIVDGKVVDESAYRYLNTERRDNYLMNIRPLDFPIKVEPGHVFVMGDNFYGSADSRLTDIGTVDARCVVGKVYARVFPLNKFTWFSNPYKSTAE